MLADRMAAALVHREPGWRLPRRSALARRYNVSLTEIDAALADLTRRSLVRRLPDGQLYRASPAEYWIPVEGAAGLATRLDPMGGTIACQTRYVSRREAPQDVAWALHLPSGAPVRVVRCVWVSAGDPAAVSTAYMHEPSARPAGEPPSGPRDEPPSGPQDEPSSGQDWLSSGPDAEPSSGPVGEPDRQADPVPSFGSLLAGLPAAAVSVEMSPPQPSIARSLRLAPGQPVMAVTIRFDDTATGEPTGLTVVMLKPELFRIAIETTDSPVTAPLTGRDPQDLQK